MQWSTSFPQMHTDRYGTTNQPLVYTDGPARVQNLPPSSPPMHNESVSQSKASVRAQAARTDALQRPSTPVSENTVVDKKASGSSFIPDSESTAYVFMPL